MRADDLWTDDRIAILNQMWADGATAAAIAARLGGLSRSAVLGKIFRLRFGAANGEQAAAKKLCAPDALERRRPNRPHRRSASPPSLPPEPKPKPLQRRMTLLELTNDTCRFPHGDPGTRNFFFCGAPGADLEGGRPYCARHACRAYNDAADFAADAEESTIENSPSIAPFDSLHRSVWRALMKQPAKRWK